MKFGKSLIIGYDFEREFKRRIITFKKVAQVASLANYANTSRAKSMQEY